MLALVTAVASLPADGVALAIAREPVVVSCASEAGMRAAEYARKAVSVRDVTLKDGTSLRVAIAQYPCLAANQHTHVWIYAKRGEGYARVLDAFSMPDNVDVSADGTAILPTHDTIDTILEATYLWSGRIFILSPQDSHVYDVATGERHRYLTPVQFDAGTSSATLEGTVAKNFGDEYRFAARAGQRMTIEVLQHTGKLPQIFIEAPGDAPATFVQSDRWNGGLPKTGNYLVTLEGGDADPATTSRYRLRVTIR